VRSRLVGQWRAATARERLIVLLALLLLVAGCAERPKAPPLVNDTVYHNDKIGLRFLAPEGWSMSSRADLPPGTLPKPIILVGYHSKKGDTAQLELMAADLPADSDLGKFLVENRIGSAVWTLQPPEKLTINGVEATRHVLTRTASRGEVRREATAFRRGERVYFFIVTFAANDPAARDAARQCVQSANWTK
jgi:hypothetical protein